MWQRMLDGDGCNDAQESSYRRDLQLWASRARPRHDVFITVTSK